MITTNIVSVDQSELVAGMAVEVWWDDIDDELTLPRFAPRREEDHDAHP
jgi:hypothetical protein